MDRSAQETWQLWPHLRWCFSHIDQILPTSAVHPDRVTPLQRTVDRTDELLTGAVHSDYGGSSTVGEVLGAAGTDSLLVMYKGKVVAEKYWRGDVGTAHIVQSVSKSIFACLAAVTLSDLDIKCQSVVPQLSAPCGWAGCTAQHLSLPARPARHGIAIQLQNVRLSVISKLHGQNSQLGSI